MKKHNLLTQLKLDQNTKKRIAFIKHSDQLKFVLRKTKTLHGKRLENSAEHSWHLCLMAWVLQDSLQSRQTRTKIQLERVFKMLIIHDLVEIIAGDTFPYANTKALRFKKKIESEAARRLFGILPKSQQKEFINVWQEFEEGKTKESQFAHFIDRIQPVLSNYLNRGGTWKQFDIKRHQIEKRFAHIQIKNPMLKTILDSSQRLNFLKP